MIYKVTIGFAGLYGCEEEYKVDADTREEAEELALEMARDDLGVTSVESEDDEDE